MTDDFRRRLRTLFCCTVLEIGALFGIPMRADDIERLLRSLAAPQVAHTIPEEDEKGGDADPPERSRGES